MTKGRRPIPTAQKRLRSARKPSKKDVEHEPKPALGIPRPPKNLDAVAVREWQRVTKELVTAGMLAYIDRAALAAYCQAWSRWEAAQAAVAVIAKQAPLLGGMVIQSRGILKQNPAVQIMKDAEISILRFAIEFGMTPASRSRMHVHLPRPGDDEQAADKDQGQAPFDEFAIYQ